MEQPAPSRASAIRAWLDGCPEQQFTVILYLLRWAIVLPLGLLLRLFATSADKIQLAGDPWRYFLPLLVIDPAFETLIECTLPYWVMHSVLRTQRQKVWLFVFVSAMAMVVLHPLTPIVFVFAFITGSFLGYVYAHFAPQSHLKAFLHTAGFHAAINIVGLTEMFISSMA